MDVRPDTLRTYVHTTYARTSIDPLNVRAEFDYWYATKLAFKKKEAETVLESVEKAKNHVTEKKE